MPANHPLRTIKRFADAALLELSPLFDEMYAADGLGSCVDFMCCVMRSIPAE